MLGSSCAMIPRVMSAVDGEMKTIAVPQHKKPDALGAGGGASGPTWRGWGIDAALREPMSMPTMIVANDVPRRLAERFSRGSLNV